MAATNQSIIKNEKLHFLTPREQEILNLLLGGFIPKEIAYTLKISYATVLDHQKNIYRKLEVNKINELLIKFSKTDTVIQHKQIKQESFNAPSGREVKAVFLQCGKVIDDHGSYINFASNIEKINEKNIESYAIYGNVSEKNNSYTGIAAFPDDSTLEAMRKAEYFSFKVLGDGNSYEAILATKDGVTDSVYNFFGKEFTAGKNVISTFNFKIDELSPSPFFGFNEPLNRNNIEVFYIQCLYKGDFNLKIWDISFYL